MPHQTPANFFLDRTVPSTDQARAEHLSRLSATQQHTNLVPKPTQAPSMQVYVRSIVQASLAVDGRKRVSNSSPLLVPSGACRLGRHPLAPMASTPMER